ncbi:hypothetical protein PMAYCL1PPCAC_19551 [Pristionchus mayeri]|uniref:Uncharacterized protein n=1 Tax=Pristionchus mayeri TaxID=1317129 RepID=A0AAN5CRF4_9BILA|nr:hypothetical protein PMAYCL1PPCAC_19551 [Pristionchus mayeri]
MSSPFHSHDKILLENVKDSRKKSVKVQMLNRLGRVMQQVNLRDVGVDEIMSVESIPISRLDTATRTEDRSLSEVLMESCHSLTIHSL